VACASGPVSARDAAITLLALTTGLRACNIVALRLADVDWRGQTIGIVAPLEQRTHWQASANASSATARLETESRRSGKRLRYTAISTLPTRNGSMPFSKSEQDTATESQISSAS